MHRIITALAAGLASGFSSYERKEGCPELYFRGVLELVPEPRAGGGPLHAPLHRRRRRRSREGLDPHADRR